MAQSPAPGAEGPRYAPDPTTGGTFGALLRLAAELGLRPPTDHAVTGKAQCGTEWEKKHLAAAIGLSVKQYENYINSTSFPRKTHRVEKAFFGLNQDYGKEWRLEFREALKRARAKSTINQRVMSVASDFSGNLRTEKNRKYHLIAGGITFALGIIHCVWLLSEILDDTMPELIRQKWPVGDFVLSFAMVAGLMIVFRTKYSQEVGIIFCVLAFVLSLLWFADAGTPDIPLMQYLFNIFSFLASGAGLWYFSEDHDVDAPASPQPGS